VLIAFDGAGLAGPITGVGRALLDGIAAYAAGGDARCVLLAPPGTALPPLAGVDVVAAPHGALARQLQLPGLLRRLGADVLHSAVAAVPLRAPCPTLATVHDLPWLHPELPEHTSRWRTFATRLAVRAAAAVLVPSAQTADDLRRWCGADAPRRLHVVPHGTRRGPAPTAAAVQARSGPLLALGDDRPRKNRGRLVRAHAAASTLAADLPPLRFVGPPHDYVDEATKHALLRECRAVVHVSLFEGFGLPVLEGLAHGAPVLCADLPPHRAIAGPHALFVDPRDDVAIAAGLVRIHRDDALRATLAAGGHERAGAFPPEAVAAAWARIHREVVA